MRIESENISEISPSQVRIPSELKEKLKKSAKQNQQSMNAEIVRRLERSYFEEEMIFESMTNKSNSSVDEKIKHHQAELLEIMVNKLKEIST